MHEQCSGNRGDDPNVGSRAAKVGAVDVIGGRVGYEAKDLRRREDAVRTAQRIVLDGEVGTTLSTVVELEGFHDLVVGDAVRIARPAGIRDVVVTQGIGAWVRSGCKHGERTGKRGAVVAVRCEIRTA